VAVLARQEIAEEALVEESREGAHLPGRLAPPSDVPAGRTSSDDVDVGERGRADAPGGTGRCRRRLTGSGWAPTSRADRNGLSAGGEGRSSRDRLVRLSTWPEPVPARRLREPPPRGRRPRHVPDSVATVSKYPRREAFRIAPGAG
jgi:hypothetical protein